MAAQLKSIFLEALRLPVEDRWTYLDSACGGDADLRRDVAELLSYHGQSGDLLDSLGVEELAGRFPLDLPARLGEFAIEGLLGSGALGVVYLARRVDGTNGHREPIALKVLRGASWSGSGQRRFRREAEAYRRLEHPGIARLVDSGTFDTPEGPLPFIATEFVPGVSLREWAAGARSGSTGILKMLRQICDALVYSHRQGVVHRDLKPENILVTPTGEPKLLDFGMARLVDDGIPARTLMTRVGQVVGTLPYMSPEQAQAGPEPVDHRTDLYSLGVIAYELLGGRLPIEVPSDSVHRAIVAILTVEPPALGEINPACRGDVEYLVGRLLAKRPADRYPEAAEVLADLDRLIAGLRLARDRRRSALRVPRRLAFAALTVLAIGIGSVVVARQLQPDRTAASHPRNRAVVAAAMRHIARAGNLLHAGDQSALLVRAALAQLDSAEARLQSLPGSLPLANVYRLLYWRQGEGHYFLGSLNNQKEEFWAARASWERSWGQWDQPFSPSVLDSTMESYREVIKSEPDLPVAGMILAHMALARYELPLTHLRRAAGHAEEGFRNLKAMADTLPWVATTTLDRDRLHGYVMTLNNYAFIQARIGYLLGDSVAIDRGLAGLREADARWPDVGVPEPRGAHLHNLGRAWRYRGIVTESQAYLDSAEAVFLRAIVYRDAARYPHDFALTQFERTRAVMDRRSLNAARLDRTLLHLRSARELVPPTANALDAAEGRIVEAEVLIELAARGRRAGLVRADSLLASAMATVTAARFPLQHAEALRVRARYWEILGRLDERPGARREAEITLTQAIDLTSPAEEPFRYARLVRERDGLSRAPDPARGAATPARTTTGS